MASVQPRDSGEVEGLEESESSMMGGIVLKELWGTGGKVGEPRGSRSGLKSRDRPPYVVLRSSRRHSSEQYKGVGFWSMTVRCFSATGTTGGRTGGAGDAPSRFESERFIAPLGLTRPVPRTRPPPPFGRMVPVRRVWRGAGGCLGLESSVEKDEIKRRKVQGEGMY